MSTETDPVQDDVVEQVVDMAITDQQPENIEPVQEEVREEQVPLSALQKERRKRQEMEQELRWHKEQMMAKRPAEPEPDDSIYEAATKEDLGKVKQQLFREVQESSWIKQNPEKAAEINERLAEFLKQRPNLANAIEAAPNRYEEAWELMDKLSPKQKAMLRPQAPKREAPGNPAATPKAASLNEAVDFSGMTDAEFNAWRQSKRQRR